MPRTFRSITVAELRDLLEDQPEDALVAFSCDYGDHGHTEQVLPISEDVEELAITESAYSQSGYAIADGQDEDPDNQTVCVIRTRSR